MGYTKQSDQLKRGVLFHLKIKNIETFANC